METEVLFLHLTGYNSLWFTREIGCCYNQAASSSLHSITSPSQQVFSCLFLCLLLSSAFQNLGLGMIGSPKVHHCFCGVACLSEGLIAASLEFSGNFCCLSFLQGCYFTEVTMPSVTAACCLLNSIFPTGHVCSSYLQTCIS